MTSLTTEEKLRKLASIDQRQAEAGWMFYLSGSKDERIEADELVDVMLHKKLGKDYKEKVFLDPVDKDKLKGEYHLGTVQYPPGIAYAPYGLRENEWIKHLLIVGMTGPGKTNLAFQILLQLKAHNKPFMVFDWKRSYRDLRQLPAMQSLKVFTIAKDVAPFHFNPLIPPPNTSPGEWLMKLVDVMLHSYFCGAGVEYLLREAIDWTYEKCGMFEEQLKEIPTFHHVKSYIYKKNVQGRMQLWKASALRVLESLTFRHGLGPVLNVDKQWDYEKLLHENVVMELDVLADADKIFFIEAMILWLYEYRKTEGKREVFKHALVIEEGHHVLSQHKEIHEGAETIMETCLRQIREFGESVVVIDQEPSKISNSIKANTYVKICFNLGNGKDIQEIARCMNLTEEEAGYIDLLDVGQAIVAMKGRAHVPLLVGFPRISLIKGIIADPSLRSTYYRKILNHA